MVGASIQSAELPSSSYQGKDVRNPMTHGSGSPSDEGSSASSSTPPSSGSTPLVRGTGSASRPLHR